MNCIAAIRTYLRHWTHKAIVVTALLLPALPFPFMRRMSKNDLDADKQETYSLEYFKTIYRQRRDAFHANAAVNEELRFWKARDDDFHYVEL